MSLNKQNYSTICNTVKFITCLYYIYFKIAFSKRFFKKCSHHFSNKTNYKEQKMPILMILNEY